jgi:polysaccharide deacetylase family protein (PEP-CTERM system associated)
VAATTGDRVINAMTVDVEDYFHVSAFDGILPRGQWDSLESRVVRNTERLLELFGESRVTATFFVLGWVAERHPELVRDILAGGHELGTHGYAHHLVYRQTPAEFAADLEASLAALQRAAGGADGVLGYRAPAFSLTDETRWALRIVRDHGLRYDSSILPVAPRQAALRGGKRYGMSGASRFAMRVPEGLWEFPLSTVRLGGRNLPVVGGGWFRILPLWLTRRAIRRINAEGQPAVLYLHPWEMDPEEPPVAGAPRLARFRHRVNVGRTEGRLRTLLREGPFGPLREVFAAQLGQ